MRTKSKRHLPRLSEWGTALLVGAALAFAYGIYEVASKPNAVTAARNAERNSNARKDTLDLLIQEFKVNLEEIARRSFDLDQREAVIDKREEKLTNGTIDLPARPSWYQENREWSPILTCTNCKPQVRINLGQWGDKSIKFKTEEDCNYAANASVESIGFLSALFLSYKNITFECKQVQP